MRMRRMMSAVTAMMVVTVLTVDPAAGGQWHHEPESAAEEAARLQAPLLLHFYADWCGPCRRMERETLTSTELTSKLGETLVGVMVDCDKHQNLVQRYNVRALPSDVLVDHDGNILARSDGYQQKSAYLARIEGVETKFTAARDAQLAKAESARQTEAAEVNSAASAQPTENTVAEKPEESLGLNGYSPVSLAHHRSWQKGQETFAAEVDGITYYMVSAEELAEFQENPDRFAPKFLGCDPVELAESNRAIPGSVQYGAYFDGALYLFADKENRVRFKKDPTQFLQHRHALRVDDTNGRVLR